MQRLPVNDVPREAGLWIRKQTADHDCVTLFRGRRMEAFRWVHPNVTTRIGVELDEEFIANPMNDFAGCVKGNPLTFEEVLGRIPWFHADVALLYDVLGCDVDTGRDLLQRMQKMFPKILVVEPYYADQWSTKEFERLDFSATLNGSEIMAVWRHQ
jgi:hypothetical protein